MKKLLLSILFVSGFSGSAQTVLFEDSFETYTDFVITGFGDWSTLDLDLRPTYTGGVSPVTWANAGQPQAFQIFNPAVAGVTNIEEGEGTPPSEENRNFDPNTGDKYAASWAAVPNASQPANNDWLISPPITLGSSGNELSVFVKSMSSTYFLEEYSIGVYVGSGNPTSGSDFIATDISGFEAPYFGWENIIVDLDAYSNQTVRIGIRNQGNDHYMFMVDDFKITTTGLSVNETFTMKFNANPNPAQDVINISNNENIILNNITVTDINGRIVKSVKVSNVSETQINVSDLNAGIYFMNINTDSGVAVKKIIKN